MAEILSLREAVRRFVHDGDSVALEGFTHLIPTAAGHELIRGLQTMDHYGFVVDSVEELEAWYRYLKALGVTLLDQPFDHGDGARSFHLLDPAGNKVQPLYHPAVSGQRLA
ncbi:VOC family protein [Pseudomonas aeruginosa]|nr:VOC family protein [Pseudomonas aeruginosa]